MKLLFGKAMLRTQIIPDVGRPGTCNNLPGNFKSVTGFNSFKHNIKRCFFKKLDNVEADIYSYT